MISKNVQNPSPLAAVTIFCPYGVWTSGQRTPGHRIWEIDTSNYEVRRSPAGSVIVCGATIKCVSPSISGGIMYCLILDVM